MPTPLDYQIGDKPDPDGDVAVVNYTGATLPIGTLVVLDTVNQMGGPTPGATYWNSPHYAVKKPATGVPATGSLGVLLANLPAGQTGVVRTRGIENVTARGAVAAGHLVSICSTASFEGRGQSAGSSDEALGMAMVTAADGDVFPVRLFGAVVIVP
jgi:hypothetical protein